MCFSAAASFTTSALLGVCGVVSIKNVKNRSYLPLAAFPLIFALQQALEGFIWLSLPTYQIRASYLSIPYLFLALFWWQFFMPFSSAMIEKNHLRKMVLLIFMMIGIISGSYLFFHAFIDLTAPRIVGTSIHYFFDAPHRYLLLAIYGITSFGSALISSDKFIRWFGILLLVSAVVTAYYYEYNYASVWCYFGAVLSAILSIKFLVSSKK